MDNDYINRPDDDSVAEGVGSISGFDSVEGGVSEAPAQASPKSEDFIEILSEPTPVREEPAQPVGQKTAAEGFGSYMPTGNYDFKGQPNEYSGAVYSPYYGATPP